MTQATMTHGAEPRQLKAEGKHSKADKKQKNLYLSAHARLLLDALSRKMGISETAVVELLVREKADREHIVLTDQ